MFHLTLWGAWEVQVSNEKQYIITYIHTPGLTDDPPMQVLIFIFLFVSYLLSVTGKLTIIILTLVDFHLKTAMYFFLKHFSFLETLLTTVCIPRFLYSLSTGDKTISYNAVLPNYFLLLFWRTDFFFSPGHRVLWPLCGHLQTFTLCNHHEQQSLWKTCYLLLDSRLAGHISSTLPGLKHGVMWL